MNPATPDRSRAPSLVADIGGTHARFGWLAGDGSPVAHVRQLVVAEHPDLVAAASTYLDGLRADGVADAARPVHAALAVATAVTGDRIEWTNSPWSFSRAAVCAALGLRTLAVLNDFEALALALPRLRPHQRRVDARGPALAPAAAAVMAVIGPGTGLGVGAVAPLPGGGWMALPGEGGHATLAPGDDFESALLAQVRRTHEHVSAERLLSGIGLPTLHAAVAAVTGGDAQALGAPQIVQRALDGSCPTCGLTMDSFCALLGSFAGNVALTLGARGGVFVGGGIVPRLGERFFASRFRDRFEAKGRFQAYLRAIPSAVITDTLVALDGAASAIGSAREGS